VQAKKLDRIYKNCQASSKKRSLEGTNLSNQNSFAILDVDNIGRIDGHMGVVIPDFEFDKIELLKDVEIARHALYKKQSRPLPDVEEVAQSPKEIGNEEVPLLEWLDDDSENEKCTLVQSKKKKKKQVKLSLEKSVEKPTLRRSQRTAPSVYRRDGSQESSNPCVRQTNYNKK
jgi:hypothetical protein